MFPDSQDHLGEDQHLRHQGAGQEQGLRQRVKLWKNCINEGYSGLFRMIIMATLWCLRQPGPSGLSPAPKTPRCRARARTSPESEFLENIALIRVVQDHYVGHSKVFLDRQGHLGEVLCHLEAFATIRNAHKASGAQRCESELYDVKITPC